MFWLRAVVIQLIAVVMFVVGGAYLCSENYDILGIGTLLIGLASILLIVGGMMLCEFGFGKVADLIFLSEKPIYRVISQVPSPSGPIVIIQDDKGTVYAVWDKLGDIREDYCTSPVRIVTDEKGTKFLKPIPDP